MSNCVITINTKLGELKLNLKNSNPAIFLDEAFVSELKNNPDVVNKLIASIQEEAIDTGLKEVSLEDIKKDGVQANCTLSFLKESPEFKDITFPDETANILLVNNINIKGKSMLGRIINSNGEEVFIVKGTKQDVLKLANFLKIRGTLRNSITISEESPYYNDLKESLELIKLKKKYIHSIEDMLLDYTENKTDYKGIFLKNKTTAILVLETFLRNLLDYDLKRDYENPFVNTLNYLKTSLGDGKIAIAKADLFKTLKQYYPDLLKTLGISTAKKLIEINDLNTEDFNRLLFDYAKSKGIDQDLFAEIQTSKNNMDALLKLTLLNCPDFTYGYLEQNNNRIVLKQLFTPISEKYGIAFDTISKMELEKYRGYNIYRETLPDNKVRYYTSRGTLVENSQSRVFNDVQEAKSYIDNLLNRLPLKKNSLIEFKFRNSTVVDGKTVWDNSLPSENVYSNTYFLPKQIIESLDIPINSKIKIKGDELALITGDKYTLQNFQNLISLWPIGDNAKTTIIEEMNTPEKAVTYLYKVNEILGTENREDENKLKEISETINNAKSNLYYIEKRGYLKFKGNSYNIIPVNEDLLETYKVLPSEPIAVWMSAISTALQNLFGVPINLVTSEEVVQDLKGVADPNMDKAFIYNGQVYVNTSIASTNDLLHEHVHLILGILKTDPNLSLNYEKLLNLVVSTSEGRSLLLKLQERYSNLSLMDLEEEVFAKLFSGYVRKLISIETSKVFNSSKENLKKITKSIFNTDIIDIEDFYGKKLTSIFGKFNKEVSDLLQNSEINFESTIKARKISNWVSKQIKEGNIIEKC